MILISLRNQDNTDALVTAIVRQGIEWDDENDALIIRMTLTSAGCPLTDVIEKELENSLDGVVERFRINWEWMPPWGVERITDDGRDMMRALGFSI